MMKKYLFLITLPLLINCEGASTPESASTEGTEAKIPLEDRLKRDVEAALEIPATEKYGFKIYKSHLNNDSILDAIVTVNRMDYAIDQAIKSKTEAKAAELGYMGNFNFFFYYDGALDQLSVPLPVASSPGRPLDVSFEPIVSPTKNDLIVEYRIRNSAWRSYYTVINEHDLVLAFRWKVFDFAGEENPEAIKHDFVESKAGIGKDIALYTSSIDDYNPNIGDIYKYEPKITKKGTLEFLFYFDPRVAKFRLYPDGPGSDFARQQAKRKGI
jgi:hypothetical protein